MKDTVKRIKKQATEWKKLFPNHISDERLVSRKHEDTQNSTVRKQSNFKNRQKA